MSVINIVDADERKKQIIELLANAPVKMALKPFDRILIADLIISGVEKIAATFENHVEMSRGVFDNCDAFDVFVFMLMQEVTGSFKVLVDEMAVAKAGPNIMAINVDDLDVDAVLDAVKNGDFDTFSALIEKAARKGAT